MKLNPTHDNILIRRNTEKATTPGGIVIPDAAREKQCVAEVLAVGPGIPVDGNGWRKCCVNPGAVVLLARYAGTEVEHDGEKLMMIRNDDILATVER